ncbi:hypothetical protein [Lysobacter enzymogenes]|uniref:hypothetical protein n=1 Tax=Lysobacter enzymogenes TaxID=69 RepID=UPI001A974427|nr:hypothetical protein [Lysobacter enzymogenes]QQP96518.1 hypothetical protein JHW38_00220 [Lysobacter enzymogenes]
MNVKASALLELNYNECIREIERARDLDDISYSTHETAMEAMRHTLRLCDAVERMLDARSGGAQEQAAAADFAEAALRRAKEGR